MLAYFLVMKNLHSADLADYLLMIVNPIGFTSVIFSLTLFIRRKQLFYLATFTLDFLGSLLVFGNVLYYREFSDFLSVNTISGGAGMMGHGFDFASIPVYWYDIVFWLDFIVILVLFVLKKIKTDENFYGKQFSFKIFSLCLMLFGLNFWMADMTEHRLVSRQAQYDDTYVVRYLGLGPWLVTNGWYVHIANQARSIANKSDFTKVQQYIEQNRYLTSNTSMQSIGKNRNLIEIHLESFQQDLINLKINGQEVTPFLNSLYNNTNTGNSVYSFSNFFNQVGQGKTSDAENMLETSTFGLPTGSLFQNLGSTQTFQAMPAILNQQDGYSSAVFHGNVGTFYNRVNTYRSMGYQNFMDQSFWTENSENSTAWGVKDKYLFYNSIPYLEKLQQPFYVKYLTVSNHIPYTGLLNSELDPTFKTTNSGDSIVDNYFLTAHYLDQSVKEFYDYLKATGLYNKSVIVIYGDHYGISGSDSKYFAPYVDPAISKTSSSSSASPSSTPKTTSASAQWTDYNDTMMQRVPFMIDVPGSKSGYISNEYAGEIDVMPTLEHLLGIDTSGYIQFGQDLFASGRSNFVALRNRGWVTADLTKASGTSNTYYDTNTGQPLNLNASQQIEADKVQAEVNQLLDMSDALNSEDLLRFYTPINFIPITSKTSSYTVSATNSRLTKTIDKLKAKSTALLSENHGISSQDVFPNPADQLKTPENSNSSTSTSGSSSSKGAK